MEKLTRTQAIKILHEFIRTRLKKGVLFKNVNPHLKAIVFYGSTAKGRNRPDSDLDILVFVPLAIERAYTKGEYVYRFKGREINIVLRSIERLRRLAKGSHNKKEAEIFRECEVILESDKEVRRLIHRIRKKD